MRNDASRKPHILAVIPHFSATPILLNRVLTAISRQQSHAKIDIVVVANNVEMAPETSTLETHSAQLLQPGFNSGYAGALEIARRAVRSDYLWVVQEDTIPHPDCLEQLLTDFRSGQHDRPLAVVTPQSAVSLGSKTSHERGQVWNLQTRKARGPVMNSESLGFLHFSEWSPETAPFVYLSGALLLSSALSDVGGFDPTFWPYGFVDADTCFRLLKAGYAVGLSASASITHLARTPSSSHPPAWKGVALRVNRRRLIDRHGANMTGSDSPGPSIEPDVWRSAAIGMSEFVREYSLQTQAPKRGGRWARFLREIMRRR